MGIAEHTLSLALLDLVVSLALSLAVVALAQVVQEPPCPTDNLEIAVVLVADMSYLTAVFVDTGLGSTATE